jgi:hypothetical protein
MCTIVSCMDSREKHEWNDLQSLGENKTTKELQHAISTWSYGGQCYYTFFLVAFNSKFKQHEEEVNVIDAEDSILEIMHKYLNV